MAYGKPMLTVCQPPPFGPIPAVGGGEYDRTRRCSLFIATKETVMRSLATTFLSALALAAIPAHAAVSVTFLGSPAGYLDIGMNTWTREDNMKALEAMLKELGAQYAPNADLRFEILD